MEAEAGRRSGDRSYVHRPSFIHQRLLCMLPSLFMLHAPHSLTTFSALATLAPFIFYPLDQDEMRRAGCCLTCLTCLCPYIVICRLLCVSYLAQLAA